MSSLKVCIIGSGNWGSTIAKLIGNNVVQHKSKFHQQVNMWVYEELIDGKPLTSIINETHENVKYLPNVKLPTNVVAIPDLSEAIRGANLLVFVIPHQFLNSVFSQIRGKLAANTYAISLIKGLHFDSDKLHLMSSIISKELKIDVSVLSGANISTEIAAEKFSESTIGYKDSNNAILFKLLLETSYFRISLVEDVEGIQVCGALKNVVALAAGFVDGLKYGANTKAAIIRIGLMEMKRFSFMFMNGTKTDTFFESCGVADLIATCSAGRNHKVAMEKVASNKSFEELETSLLNGQKLQGTLTANEVYHFLVANNKLDQFPLFKKVYQISFEDTDPRSIVNLY